MGIESNSQIISIDYRATSWFCSRKCGSRALPTFGILVQVHERDQIRAVLEDAIALGEYCITAACNELERIARPSDHLAHDDRQSSTAP